MGQEVVRQENEDEPGQRTRLMDERDILSVLKDCSGTELVESISWKRGHGEVTHVQVEALRKMRNLRLIKLNGYNHNLSWLSNDSSYYEMNPLCFKKLKYMEWLFFPFKSLDVVDMENMIVLKLQQSKLEILWKGMKSLKKLKILDVSYSKSLTSTGNFPRLENLEELDLRSCDHLEELHGSISQLHKLRKLHLGRCAKLESIPNLPPNIEEIEAQDCESLVNLPDSIGKLHKLTKIRLGGLLESIPNLPPNIEMIETRDCRSLVNLPDNIGKLHKLREIFLYGCNSLKLIPNLPPNIETIQTSDCRSLVNLPENIGKLHKLREIFLFGCNSLKSIPILPPNIEKITLSGSLEKLPNDMGQLHKLREIELVQCWGLKSIPNLPPSIEQIEARCCTRLVNLPDSIGQLHKLTKIVLDGCHMLESIPNLPPCINEVHACSCRSLLNLPPNLCELQFLKCLRLDDCLKLTPASLKIVSTLFKDKFTKGLVMGLSVAKLIDMCNSQSNLSILAPMNLDKKICGVIIHATLQWEYDNIIRVNFPRILNATKDKYHDLPMLSQIDTQVIFCPFGNTTLLVEAGDLVEFVFCYADYYTILSGGLSLIYEDDLLDCATLIQNAYD